MALRITTWNVNGIRNPFSYRPWSESKKFEVMFDILGADIVCMQETKIQKKDLRDDMVLVPGWDSYFTFPRYKKGYSGVAVYTRNSKCQPIKAEEGITGALEPPSRPGETYKSLPPEDSIGGYPDMPQEDALLLDSEGRCLVLDFGAFILLGTYCPAATDVARDDFRIAFVQAVHDRVKKLVTELNRKVVLVGDLNIARDEIDSAHAKETMKDLGVPDWKSTPTRTILNTLLVPHKDGVMVDLCREFFPERTGMYTCWDTKMNCRPGNFGSRIDYVLASSDMKSWFREANIQEGLMGSDHCPVYGVINETVEVDGEQKQVIDLVNPPGMFIGGQKQALYTAPVKPRLCAKTFPEYSGRQSIRDMFSKISRPSSVSAGTSASNTSVTTKPVASVSKPTPDSTLPPAKRQKISGTVTQRPGSLKKAPSKGQQSLKGFFKPSQRAANKESPSKEESISSTTSTPASDAPLSSADIASSVTNTDNASETAGVFTAQDVVDDDTVIDPIVSKEKWDSIFTKRPPPKCDGHNEDCIQLITKKAGPNCGRAFWICPRPLGPGGKEAMKGQPNEWRCNYFKWASDKGGS